MFERGGAMFRVLLWMFTIIALVGWRIGEESFIIFYALLSLLITFELLNKALTLLNDKPNFRKG